MKNILILILITLSLNAAFGQIEKGKMMIGGSFANTSSKGTSFSSFTPRFGYMVDDTFMAGLAIASQTEDSAFMPFGRYYKSLKDKTYFFGELGYRFSDAGGISLAAGLNYFIKDNVTIEPSLSYTRSNQSEDDFKNIYTTIKLGIGLQFFF